MTHVILYRDETLAEGARIALKHRLYVPTWTLKLVLRDLAHGQYQASQVSIAFKDDVPVAVAVYDSQWRQVMCFVRPTERRQGIGTAVVRALEFFRSCTYANKGGPGSMEFWAANQVDVL